MRIYAKMPVVRLALRRSAATIDGVVSADGRSDSSSMRFLALQDVGDADAALDEPRFSAFKRDVFFSEKESSVPEAWSTGEFLSAVEDATRRTESGE